MTPIIVLSLSAALCTAISRTLTKYVLRYADTQNYLSVNFAVLFALLAPFAPFAFELHTLKKWHGIPVALLMLFLASAFDFIANYYYFKAFEIEDASTVSALLSLGPLFTLLASPIAIHVIPGAPDLTRLMVWDIGGTLLIVAGVGTLNRQLRATRRQDTPAQTQIEHSPEAVFRHEAAFRRLLVPLAASCLLGINAYTVKYIFSQAFMNPYTYYFLRLGLVATMAHLVFRPSLAWVNAASLATIAGRGIFVVLQWMAMLTALARGNPTIVKAVSEISPLFVIGLSMILLKEKITRDKVVGACLIIGGLLLIAV
jgi:drug/metabolite transporter (DMT)-like permease